VDSLAVGLAVAAAAACCFFFLLKNRGVAIEVEVTASSLYFDREGEESGGNGIESGDTAVREFSEVSDDEDEEDGGDCTSKVSWDLESVRLSILRWILLLAVLVWLL
jgi:hypothetical protein